MAWKSLIFTRQLSVIAQQSIPKYAVNVNLVQKSLRDDDIQVLKCSGPGSPESPKNSADKPNKLTEQQLKERQVKLCNITDQFFHQGRNKDVQMVHPNVVFENKVNGQVAKGMAQYYKTLGAITIYGHLRFAYVNSNVMNSWIDEKEQSVSVRFQFQGIGFIEMAIKYFPKKLFRRANIDREARIWFDAISTFYLNPKGKIIRHVVDNKDIDHERTVKRPIDEIKEKLAKLNKNTPTAAPALSKIHSKSV